MSEIKKSKILTLVWAIALFFWILSLAVSVPLLCRSFYYVHIDALHLTEITPWTKAEIIAAYDEMMDFCMKGGEFGTGVLKWSEDGMLHFADCAVLFRLDKQILIASSVILAVLVVLAVWKKMVPDYVGIDSGKDVGPESAVGKDAGAGADKHGPFFWGPAVLSGGFVVIAALAATDFDRAFVIFHKLFFPGKTNWIFYWDLDEIIQVLPEVFFRNCAILIVALLFVLSLFFILTDKYWMKKLHGK